MVLTDIRERLLRLDEDVSLLYEKDIEFFCYIVGGGAFMLLGYDVRSTHDIDILEYSPYNLGELFAKYDMNSTVVAYADNFPAEFKNRAVPLDLPTERIKYFILSIEDLVISKLCTTRFEQDILDITNPKVIADLDWMMLEKLANSMKNTMLSSVNYENFKLQYDDFVRRYKSCGN